VPPSEEEEEQSNPVKPGQGPGGRAKGRKARGKASRSARTATEGQSTKGHAPSTSGTAKVPPSENEDEKGPDGRRPESNPVKPGQSRCVGAKRKKAKGKAPRSARTATEGESTKGQAPSTSGTAKVPPSENEDENEDEHEDEHEEGKIADDPGGEAGLPEGQLEEVDPVKLVQAEIERVRWAKRDDCKY
jgi:hypothetical protein